MRTPIRVELRSRPYHSLYEYYPNEKVPSEIAIQYDNGEEETFETGRIEYLESGGQVFHLPDGRKLKHTLGEVIHYAKGIFGGYQPVREPDKFEWL